MTTKKAVIQEKIADNLAEALADGIEQATIICSKGKGISKQAAADEVIAQAGAEARKEMQERNAEFN